MDGLVEVDVATGCRFVLDDAPVARTVEVGDLVFVDVAADGRLVGVEFAFSWSG